MAFARDIVYLIGDREISSPALTIAIKHALRAQKANRRTSATSHRDWSDKEVLISHLESAKLMFDVKDEFNPQSPKHLYDCISLSRSRQVTDARDKVFAVLSLTSPRSSTCQTSCKEPGADGSDKAVAELTYLVTDYNKTAVEVYIECLKCLLQGTTGLAVLSLVGLKAPHIDPKLAGIYSSKWIPWRRPNFAYRIEGLPSFVPDLTMPPQPRPLRSLSKIHFSIAINLSPEFWFSQSDKVLHLKCCEYDKIVQIAEDSSTL